MNKKYKNIKILKKIVIQLIENYFVIKKIIIGYFFRVPYLVINSFKTKIIARPGTLGYKGGVFNAGATLFKEKIILLGKGQKMVWYKARGKNRKQFLKGNPVQFILNNKNLSIINKSIVEERNFPNKNDYAIEDFRLFIWKNKIGNGK